MHFCTYALCASVEGDVSGDTRLPLTGARLSRVCAVAIDAVWLRVLGQAFADDCAAASLYIDVVAKFPPDAADIAEKVYFSLWLHGLLRVGEAVAVVGRVASDGTRAVDSPLSVVRPGYLESRALDWPTLNAATLDSVDRVAAGLRERDRRQDEFCRLWHGLRALRRALTWDEQHDAYERGANLVRSVEAIVFKPGERAGAKDFGKRVARLCDGVSEAELADAYHKVRSAYVHMHKRYVQPDMQAASTRFDELSALVEDLALCLWRQILGDPAVRETVSDERLPALQCWLRCGTAGDPWLGVKCGSPARPVTWRREPPHYIRTS